MRRVVAINAIDAPIVYFLSIPRQPLRLLCALELGYYVSGAVMLMYEVCAMWAEGPGVTRQTNNLKDFRDRLRARIRR